MTAYDGNKFREWWAGLTPEQRRPYQDKARWEQRERGHGRTRLAGAVVGACEAGFARRF